MYYANKWTLASHELGNACPCMLIHGPRLVFQFNLAFKIVCQTFTKWFMFINMPFDLPNGIWKKCWYFVAISRAQLTIDVSKIVSRLSRDLRDCRTMWMGHSFFSIHNLRMRSFHNEVTNFREKQIWLQAGSLRLFGTGLRYQTIVVDRKGLISTSMLVIQVFELPRKLRNSE